MGRSSILAASLALALGALPSGADVVQAPIQPGARMSSPVGGCTMNFIFRDAVEDLYVGTAGHCTNVGDRVSDADGTEVGTTVFSYQVGNDDFALIEIDGSRYGDVSPQLRQWGGPTGVTTASETAFLAPILHYGFGIGYGSTEVTRPRRGLLYYDDTNYYRTLSPISNGDSGGPVLHEATGKALGVVSNISGLLEGPSVERALALAAREGLHLAIVTAPYPG